MITIFTLKEATARQMHVAHKIYLILTFDLPIMRPAERVLKSTEIAVCR